MAISSDFHQTLNNKTIKFNSQIFYYKHWGVVLDKLAVSREIYKSSNTRFSGGDVRKTAGVRFGEPPGVSGETATD